MPKRSRAHIRVTGRVQGVGFRFFTRNQASLHGISGWVRNRPDGSVEIEAEAARERVEAFISEIRNGSRFAAVDAVDVDWIPVKGASSFEVIG